MATASRRHRASPDIWPGFVDAISALLIILIFVLIVFALAQFFLTADLSNRNEALQRLNREVAELADMLSIERSANTDLRDDMSRMSAQLTISIAERDRLSSELGELLPERDALSAMLAERTSESETFSALLSERTVERDKLIEELTRRATERDALTVQMAEIGATAEKAIAEAAKVSGDLEDAYKTIGADKDKIEIQLRRIASIERDIVTLRDVRETLESQVSELARTLKARDQTLAESRAELEARAKAIADRDKTLADRDKTLADRDKALAGRDKALAGRDKALAGRDKDLSALRDRSKELTAELSSARERTVLAQKEIDEKDVRLKDLLGRATKSEVSLSKEQKLSVQARKMVAALNLQLVALRRQLARLATVLNASEAKSKDRQVRIANLGKRLNAALASKVQELARYRSEFFGRLRKVLGDHKDIRIVGDRFVFQSEVLFASGSDDLQPLGRDQIAKLARTLSEISAKIPKQINWVLRVDGHTDVIPISTPEFPSNWELSTARAISVVKQLIEAGIPANRLAATGFGEFQPLDSRSDEIAFRRNRRIEFKLTER